MVIKAIMKFGRTEMWALETANLYSFGSAAKTGSIVFEKIIDEKKHDDTSEKHDSIRSFHIILQSHTSQYHLPIRLPGL